ncbi:unnamed protein product [Bemisia tabaci]|uniref:Ig-like domain-containing protein n=1 Tax=Bemisia tabaci TaxID=7038 RepID=A0A9P0A1Q4_BEMTA|nr:unnamed protein product [Bemisia tabaci]
MRWSSQSTNLWEINSIQPTKLGLQLRVKSAFNFRESLYVSVSEVVSCCGCLRDVNLQINPSIVQRGHEATLFCQYELEDGAPLYSVKWYRGRHEFYRYSPTEKPSTKIFPYEGINVDRIISGHLQFEVSLK